MTMRASLRRREPVRMMRLWAAYLLPPTIWSSHLLFAYLFSSFTCAYGGTATVRTEIALITAIALAAIAACGWMGYTEAKDLDVLGWDHAEREIRSRGFMARTAMFAAMLFFIATLFEAAPAFALRTC
jgi:hypothetical protein